MASPDDILEIALNALVEAGFSKNDAGSVIIPALIDNGLVIREVAAELAEARYNVSLDELVFTALGQVSMCWIPGTGDAEFDSRKAAKIGNNLIKILHARGER